MTKFDYSLLEDFQIHGHWWLPHHPEKRVAGTLTFQSGEITLDLLGLIPRETPSNVLSNKSNWASQIIHGSCDAMPFTAFRTHNIGLEVNSAGVDSRSKFSAEYLISNSHLESESDLQIKSAAIEYTEFEEWIYSKPLIEVDRSQRTEGVVNHKLNYPETFEIPITSLDVTLKTQPSFVHSEGHMSVSAEYQDRVVVSTESILTLSELRKLVFELRNFLALMIGHPIRLRKLEIQSGSETIDTCTIPRTSRVFFAQGAESTKPAPRHWEMLFRFCDIKNQLGSVLNAWFARSDQLKAVYDLFLGTLYNDKQFLNFQFLSLIQAIEAFDRIRGTSCYMTEEEYEPIRAALTNAIPAHLSNPFKTSLRKKIEHGHEFSLRKRLRQRLDDLAPGATELVCHNCSQFIDKIVNTRNYFTHYTDELETLAELNGEKLFFLTQRLRILLTLLLLKDLGLEEGQIVAAIQKNNRLRFILEDAGG